jgi:hypothetical protein
MRFGLAGLIVVGAAFAAIATEVIAFGMLRPPDMAAAFLGGAWLAAPYLVALLLALVLHNRAVPLLVLLIAFLLAAVVGLSLFGKAAVTRAELDEQLRTAVQPGEDPSHGPAAMRKNGAEIGAAIGWGFSVLEAVVVPPVQLVIVIVPTLIAFCVSVLGSEKRRAIVGKPGD